MHSTAAAPVSAASTAYPAPSRPRHRKSAMRFSSSTTSSLIYYQLSASVGARPWLVGSRVDQLGGARFGRGAGGQGPGAGACSLRHRYELREPSRGSLRSRGLMLSPRAPRPRPEPPSRAWLPPQSTRGAPRGSAGHETGHQYFRPPLMSSRIFRPP